MPSKLDTVNEYWSAYANEAFGRNLGVEWWDAGPEIQYYRNRRVTGDPEVNWVQYTLRKYFDGKLPLSRCLSLGCGNGGLERQLASLGAFAYCDAYDVAEGAIHWAKSRAAQLGINNIGYHVADINRLTLTARTYDAVWISLAMHHFEALERIDLQIQGALKPDGFLILQEYVGPSRFQFPPRQKELINHCLALLPAAFRIRTPYAVDRTMQPSMSRGRNSVRRLIDKVRDGDLIGAISRRLLQYRQKLGHHVSEKKFVTFPTARDVIASDPSEAIRSDEIVKVLQQNFEIVEYKGWGGNILQFLLADIASNFNDGQHEHGQAYLRMILNIEETLLQSGELKSDFAYIVARPLGN